MLTADDDLGVVIDCYVDRLTWVIKYIVADTAGSLPVRYALISPSAVRSVDWLGRIVRLELTREQLRASPALDFARPLYWSGEESPAVAAEAYAHDASLLLQQGRKEGDPIMIASLRPAGQSQPSLYSGVELADMQAEGVDGVLGRLIDLLYEERTWTLRYLLLDTVRLVPDSHLLISTQWIDKVCSALCTVSFLLGREAIRHELLLQHGLDDPVERIGSPRCEDEHPWRYWH